MDLGFRLYFTDKTLHIDRTVLTATVDGTDTVYQTELDGIRVTWRFSPYGQGELISLSVASAKPLGLRRIDSVVFTLPPPTATDRILFLGRDMHQNETRFHHELGIAQEYGTNCAGLFGDLSAEGIMLAGVEPFRNIYRSAIDKQEDGTLTFCAKTEFTEGMADATELCAEKAYLCERTTVDEFFTAYRPLLPISHFPMPKLTGWNTWDYYLDKVTPADIAENVAALKEMPFADALDYIVIDDGWQRGWGDWRENETFSCGLPAVAKTIREAGFTPGIWMTPVGIREDSAVFAEHGDWLCRNEHGELLFEMGLYYMDPTHPDALRFIQDNYRYQYEAGFRLFKMDYVSPLLHVKRFYDKNATPYEVLAEMVRQVQACTGPDAVILGCSLPLECGADIAPSMRIAVDIHNHFSHAIWIAQSLAWSWMHNNRTTRIDPDFIVVRGEETSDEPLTWAGGKRNDFLPPPRALQTDRDRFKSRWRHGDQFNAVEAETWANLCAVSGGNLFLSDRMSALNARGIEIIRQALTLAGEEMRPRYLADDLRLPSVWMGDRALLLVNWEDVPRRITLPGFTRSVYADKPHRQENGDLTVTLLPHESFAAHYRD
ncbi:MAG: alpha-galactosidase [Clostridia bacterium]|nr:alpha-galactosidase [Clostridia bacterium]